MHELSIAQAIVEQVVAIVRRESASRAISVTVAVGALSGVDPESLKFVFPMVAEDTPAHSAELIVQSVAARVRCRACGAESAPELPFVACAACGATDIELQAGRELHIVSAEIETD